jgi:hypothetical protein
VGRSFSLRVVLWTQGEGLRKEKVDMIDVPQRDNCRTERRRNKHKNIDKDKNISTNKDEDEDSDKVKQSKTKMEEWSTLDETRQDWSRLDYTRLH